MELHQEEERIVGNLGIKTDYSDPLATRPSSPESWRTRPCHGTPPGEGADSSGNRKYDGLQRSLGNQALIYKAKGELDRAMELLKERERICRELGNDDGLQRSLGNQTLIQQSRILNAPVRKLENVRHDLHEEIERRTSLDVRCDELTREREQTEKALNAQANELEQLKSALTAEEKPSSSCRTGSQVSAPEQESIRAGSPAHAP